MDFTRTDVVIGRVSHEYAGQRNSAELRVSVRIDSIASVARTTDHRWVHGYKVLAISAGVWNRSKTDFVACGQIREALDYMVSYVPGWNAAKVQRLRQIWDAWHLNDMNAGCVHQKDTHDPCPETGYKYGHGWLLRELPAEVEAEVIEMFTA